MKLDDGRLTFVAQQEVTALDAIHKAVLGKAACAGRVTEGVGTCISIHAPTWGATCSEKDLCCSSKFQSTHPRGVRPVPSCRMVRLSCISIHAPTWGATGGGHIHVKLLCISIHAPTWGATSDDKRQECGQDISIHAPTWGATILNLFLLFRQKYFNPRTHVGCDSGRG